MKIVYFAHSLGSCWNHGNAHFLRGVLRELQALGHAIEAWEPRGNWSTENLLRDHGEAGLAAFRLAYKDLPPSRHHTDAADIEAAVADADLVIAHEWNDPGLLASLGRARRAGARFSLLFHDTHHRAVSDPSAMRAIDLDGYDGVLAFGEALAQVYRAWGWGNRVFTWHEAADTRLFRPCEPRHPRAGLVWIGNWGDDERSAELVDYLLHPARALGLQLDIHGVRYPEHAMRTLAQYGAAYRGWLANPRAPLVYGHHLATVHVPRRFYARILPGIPTIRVFEALACGIPMLSAPWNDSEGLFRVGQDFLMARNPDDMLRHLRSVRDDADLRASLVAHGLETIQSRHTCAHRAAELLDIVASLRGTEPVLTEARA